jgi:uncharacterized protein with ParB-like and HNH nuclease domain
MNNEKCNVQTTRSKPYHTTQTTWKTIFGNTNIIPMNQRNYDWDTEPHIIKFINDMFDIFKTSYFEKMGTIIYYETIEGKEVWDGQQRMITIILYQFQRFFVLPVHIYIIMFLMLNI